MSLENFSRGILQKSQDIKNNFDLELKEECATLQKEQNQRINSSKKDLDSKFFLELNNRKSQLLGNFESTKKSLELESKLEVEVEVKSKVEDYFLNLDSKSKKSIYKKLIDEAQKNFKIGKVFCLKDDLNLVESLIKKVDVEEIDLILGGLIFENVENTLRMNLSFDVLIEESLEKNFNLEV